MSVEIVEEFDDEDEWEDFDPEPATQEFCLHCVHPLKQHSEGMKCKVCKQNCGNLTDFVKKVATANGYDATMCNLCNHGEHERCSELKMIFCTCYKKGH